MAEATQVKYGHAELTALMLKDRGIHEGFWMLLIEFGFGAANMGPADPEMHPTALVAVSGIGLQKMPALGPLCVDAAVVNPRTA